MSRLHRPAPHHPRAGISLLESLVLLAILAVVVGLALPKLTSSRFLADANVRLVTSALTSAAELSRKDGVDVLVSFDVGGNRIRTVSDRNRNRSLDGSEPSTWLALVSGVHFATPGESGAPSAQERAVGGSELINVDAMPTLLFQAGGSAASNLVLYFAIDASRGRALRKISMEQESGAVEWFRFSGSEWRSGRD